MMEAHVLAILILGVSSFIVGTIPLKISRSTQQPFLLSLLLCWGGGVLFATSIVHMLAEVREKLPKYSELIFCAGFLLIYTIDEALHLCSQKTHAEEDLENVISRECSRRDSSSSSDGLMKAPPICHRHRTSYGTIDKLPKRARFFSLSQSFHDETMEDRQKSASQTQLFGSIRSNSESCKRNQSFQTANDSNPGPSCGHKKSLEEIYSDSSGSSVLNVGMNQCHVEVQKPCTKQRNSSISGLLTALIIHSILEGCSIGVQTNSSEILLILGAVACHKLVLAFCIGMELSLAGFEGFRFIIALTAFSIGCPIGIAVGVSVTHASAGVFVVEAPLQALAAGSLLYVAVFEVLPRERYKWQHRAGRKLATFFQMLAVIAGFLLIVLLSLFFDSHHSDGTYGADQSPL